MVAGQNVPVKVQVMVEALSEDNDRSVGRQPKLATQSEELVLAKGTEDLSVRRPICLRHE